MCAIVTHVRTVTNKTTHLGRAGEFAAMSEILARGWNVAIPEVDMGDDVFVARDDGTRLTRVQVKTTQATPGDDGTWTTATNKLSYPQLRREGEEVPLLYVFAARVETRWEFVVISRDEMRDVWRRFERSREAELATGARLRGRPRKHPEHDREEAAFDLTFSAGAVLGPGSSNLQAFRNDWGRFELLLIEAATTAPAT